MRALLEKRDPSTLAYLTYMIRRLARIHAAMKPTATIYLHCDPTASHYLKLAMDAIFGRGNFHNEIIWFYHRKSPGREKIRPAIRFSAQTRCNFSLQRTNRMKGAPRFFTC